MHSRLSFILNERGRLSPRRLQPRRSLWLVPPLLVLVSTVVLAVQQARVPSLADWTAAAEAIGADLKPGDGVAFAPPHAGEARLVLHDLPAFHLGPPQLADLARYDRVWLMGAFGNDADDLPPGHALAQRRQFGAVTLDLVTVGGPKVVGDLYAELEAARVTRRHPDGREEACDFWDGRRWQCGLRQSPDLTRACLAKSIAQRLRDKQRDPHCGLDPWINVGRDVRIIGAEPRRCVWLHPMDRAEVNVTWPTTAAAGDELVVDFGFTDQVIVDHDRPASRTRPASIEVFQGDGLALGKVEVAPEPGWRRQALKLRSGEPLRLVARTQAMVDAHLCVDVTVRRGRP
jgi:hypothetical protein